MSLPCDESEDMAAFELTTSGRLIVLTDGNTQVLTILSEGRAPRQVALNQSKRAERVRYQSGWIYLQYSNPLRFARCRELDQVCEPQELTGSKADTISNLGISDFEVMPGYIVVLDDASDRVLRFSREGFSLLAELSGLRGSTLYSQRSGVFALKASAEDIQLMSLPKQQVLHSIAVKKSMVAARLLAAGVMPAIGLFKGMPQDSEALDEVVFIHRDGVLRLTLDLPALAGFIFSDSVRLRHRLLATAHRTEDSILFRRFLLHKGQGD